MAKQTPKAKPQLQNPKIIFEDIVGHTHIKERLRSIIKIIQNPKKLHAFDISMPKGLLIYGPSSVGKKMLANAFVNEAKMRYYEISGSNLFDLNYIKEVYDEASKHAPCVVILEDIDIQGIMQGALTQVSFSDIAKVLESFDTPIFTIATAQSLDGIDPVLTAPQKLDFLIEVAKLDRDARGFFIDKILQKPHDESIDKERIIRYITGMSAMELERLGRMAALSVIEQGGEVITEEILIEQINIIKYGHKVEAQMIKNLEEEMKMTAYHEASHAVLSSLLLPHIKIEQVTISRRSKMLGFVSYNAEDETSNLTKEELFHDVCILLAGRMAKIKKVGEAQMDSGATSDLSQASLNIYAAISNLGMDKELGFINIDAIAMLDTQFLALAIEKRFLFWMKEAQKVTQKLVDEHWEMIEQVALLLIEKEIVEGDELSQIVGDKTITNNLPETI
ncbi:MAG: AAA family ATPase [Campylobacterota bacterium]|nr:AAA family ATPase [Campylobacterota bacterium]